jgi:hypothetical protein
MRQRLGLIAVLAGLVASVIFLHRLALEFPLSALESGPLEVALGTVARLVGLVVAYWLLGSSLLLILARLAAIPAAIRAASWITWGPFRKLIERSVASSLVLALSGSPAAGSVEPSYVPVPAGDPTTTSPPTSLPSPTTTIPITIADPVDTLYLPIEAPSHLVEVAVIGETEVTVRQGDNMWKLAEQRLRELKGEEITDADVAPYWLAVIAANRNRIRSGDPDLIFPGEVLILPEW